MKLKGGVLTASIFLTLGFVWGSSFILMKKSMLAFTWDEVSALRLILSSACLLPVFFIHRKLPDRRTLGWLVVTGLLGNGIPAFLFTLAETVIDSGTAGVLNSLSPLFAFLTGIWIFGTQFSVRKMTGVMIGLAGAVLLILANGESSFDLSGKTAHLLIVVAATFCYGLNGNIIKQKLSANDPVWLSAWAMLFCGIPSLVYLPFTGAWEALSAHPEGFTSLIYVVILAAIGTAFALVIFNKLIMMTEAVFASAVAYLVPVVALFWAWADHESIEATDLLGLFVIFGGLYLIGDYKKMGT